VHLDAPGLRRRARRTSAIRTESNIAPFKATPGQPSRRAAEALENSTAPDREITATPSLLLSMAMRNWA
jgi:hypothetical protein